MTHTLDCTTLLVHERNAPNDFFTRATRFTLLADAHRGDDPRVAFCATVAEFDGWCGNARNLLQSRAH